MIIRTVRSGIKTKYKLILLIEYDLKSKIIGFANGFYGFVQIVPGILSPYRQTRYLSTVCCQTMRRSRIDSRERPDIVKCPPVSTSVPI